MSSKKYDVIILGSGFGGSLLGAILAKSGRSVALVDNAQHPRFAIGESSTPLANQTLAQLARQYELPELLPLTHYRSWKSTHTDLGCGLKRGFSYFGHQPHQAFKEENQLLVIANAADEIADTHWLRSDIDEFFCRLAERQGVQSFENATYTLDQRASGWQVTGTCANIINKDQEGESQRASLQQIAPVFLNSDFIIDATGGNGVVLKSLGIPQQTASLKTNSFAIFAHFAPLHLVADVFDQLGVDTSHHPYPCDAAAVHHVLDSGWMWQLRFDDETVSAGLVLDQRSNLPAASSPIDAKRIWDEQLRRFSFLQKQFAGALVVRPKDGLQMTRRMQRLASTGAGKNWAALPSTIGFIDPLHSTGIAHTLFGVRRLAVILLNDESQVKQTQRLHQYSMQTIEELRLIDELVEGCYAALPNFRLWSAWCMLYFAAATSMEQTLDSDDDSSFLNANKHSFRRMLLQARRELQTAIEDRRTSLACAAFEERLRKWIDPWNRVGLLDPDNRGMYRTTASPI